MGRTFSTKKMSGSEKSVLINNILASHDEALARDQRRIAERREYDNSPKGKKEIAIRESNQRATAKKDEAFDMIRDAAKVLRNETFELVKQVLFDENGNKKELTKEEFFTITKYFDMSFTNLKTLCGIVGHAENRSSEYEKLMFDLMDQLDIRFALIAPSRSLTLSKVSFSGMPEDCIEDAIKHFKELGLTNSYDFRKTHGKHFNNFVVEEHDLEV